MDPATRSVLSLARSVLGELDLDVVLERVLEASRELTGAKYAALGVLDETRRELARFLTVGIDEATRREVGPLPRGRGVLGELITDPVPLRLADVAAHPWSYGFPVGHPPMRSFLGVPVLVGAEPYGNLYLTDKRGAAAFTAEDEEAVVLLAEFAGVAIDHARRYTGSEQRRTELQRTVDALEATIEIARALGGQTDLPAILELVAKRGRALVSAQALVIELERDGGLFVAAGAGALPQGLVGQGLSLEDTVASAALRTGRPQRLADKLNRTALSSTGSAGSAFRRGTSWSSPWFFATGHTVRWWRSTGSTASSSPPSTSGCSRRSRPARRPRWPQRSPPPTSAAARPSRRRRQDAGAGHASCTTRPSRASPPFA